MSKIDDIRYMPYVYEAVKKMHGWDGSMKMYVIIDTKRYHIFLTNVMTQSSYPILSDTQEVLCVVNGWDIEDLSEGIYARQDTMGKTKKGYLYDNIEKKFIKEDECIDPYVSEIAYSFSDEIDEVLNNIQNGRVKDE